MPSLKNVLALAALAVLFSSLAHPVLVRAGGKSDRVACAKNLYTLHEAHVAYQTGASNYLRIYPHCEFDEEAAEVHLVEGEGMAANRTAFAKLVRHGLIDDTSKFICPASQDERAPLKSDGKQTFRFSADEQLSYTYTNIMIDVASNDQFPVVVDRRAGMVEPYSNHLHDINVLFKGGSVKWISLEEIPSLRHPRPEHRHKTYPELFFWTDWGEPPAKPEVDEEAEGTGLGKYICPKCLASFDERGLCPLHDCELRRIERLICPQCKRDYLFYQVCPEDKHRLIPPLGSDD